MQPGSVGNTNSYTLFIQNDFMYLNYIQICVLIESGQFFLISQSPTSDCYSFSTLQKRKEIQKRAGDSSSLQISVATFPR